MVLRVTLVRKQKHIEAKVKHEARAKDRFYYPGGHSSVSETFIHSSPQTRTSEAIIFKGWDIF